MNRPEHEQAQAGLQVLLVEDNPGDARLIQEMLHEAGVQAMNLIHRTSLDDGIAYMRQSPVDVLLLDLSLPESTGLRTVHRVLEHATEIPVVVLTGANDGELAIDAVKAGVQDYLVKGDTDSDWLLRCIRYAVERKRGAQALAKKNEELEERNQNLRQLTFAMTHDLQTPLTSMTGAVEILEERLAKTADAKTRDWLHRADHAAHRMMSMLDELMHFAKAGAEPVHCRPTSISTVLEDVLSELIAQASQNGITIRSTLGDRRVQAEPDALYRILVNVVGNAIKYSKPGSEIVLSAVEEGHCVHLCVEDHGQGIAPEKIAMVFLPFKRADTAHPGTGLGLSIARRYTEALGGRIWLESDGAHGTTAHIVLQSVDDSPTGHTPLAA